MSGRTKRIHPSSSGASCCPRTEQQLNTNGKIKCFFGNVVFRRLYLAVLHHNVVGFFRQIEIVIFLYIQAQRTT